MKPSNDQIKRKSYSLGLNLNDNMFSSFLVLAICVTSLLSCSVPETEREVIEQLANDSRIQLLENWEWETENKATIPFEGRLLITAVPKLNNGFSSTQVSHTSLTLPQAVRIKLPIQEQILGTVSVALEPAAEASSLVLDAWLRSLNYWDNYDVFHNANPFSSAQLLFYTSTRQSGLNGQMSPRTFELFVSPNALPPYVFFDIKEANFNLNLPPVSNVKDVNIKVWQSLVERIALSGAKVSLWNNQQLLTSVNISDINGELKLNYWQESLEENTAEQYNLELLVSPKSEEQLPILRKSVNLAEINNSEVEVVFPNLEPLIKTSLRVDINSSSNNTLKEPEIWTVWLKQVWVLEPDQDYSLPGRIEGGYGEAVWSKSYPIIPSRSNEIEYFDHTGTLFLNPPADSSQRTQRIEFSSLPNNETLRFSSLPKPLVRGVLRSQDGTTLEAKILMTQLAWPWREAVDLPLNQFITYSNSEGGFSIAVEPGVYALSYLPLLKDYAPKVILLKIPETEGLILSPQQSLIDRGQSMNIRIAGEGEQVSQLESRLQLECLIARDHPIFLGTSEYGNKQSKFKIHLYKGVLKENEILNLRLSKATCPNLFTRTNSD